MTYYSLGVVIMLLSYVIAIWLGKDDVLCISALTLGIIGGYIFLRLGKKS